MALRSRSLFTYGFEINTFNRFISFVAVSSGPTLTATLNVGFYTLTSLGAEIIRALSAADPIPTYSFNINRTIAGGTQNRFTIATSGAYLDILFSSGNPSNPASLIGFLANDFTGATTYTGSFSCGTTYSPSTVGYNYLSPPYMQKNFGVATVSAAGIKEAITFQLQNFWKVQFMHVPQTEFDANWIPLITWMIQQKPIEYTPEVGVPGTFFSGTLEDPSGGMEITPSEQLSMGMPFFYSTPMMKFRVQVN